VKVHRAMWIGAVSIELALAGVAYYMSRIIKWPPDGPIRIYVGWPVTALLFVALSGCFWLIVGVTTVWVRRIQGKDDYIRIFRQ
jgi:hypothetical protein